jgi:hypothetical protein
MNDKKRKAQYVAHISLFALAQSIAASSLQKDKLYK